MNKKQKVKNKLRERDIFWADFGGGKDDVITSGIHPCVIVKLIGNIAQVIPITSFKGKIFWTQKMIAKSDSELPRKSILKIEELRPIGISKILKGKIGELGIDRFNEIKEFIKDLILV